MQLTLNDLSSLLGLGDQPAYAQQQGQPQTWTGAVPTDLLGPSGELPAQGPAQQIPINDQSQAAEPMQTVMAPERASPTSLGMPAMPAMRMPDPAEIADQRAALKASQETARQLYHPKSEFGTHGILRDVIGNVTDFGRQLLGIAPRYNEEKWLEKAYGMTSDNPAIRAAATEAAMQYNPTLTDKYAASIDKREGDRASMDSNTEYRKVLAANRYANILSGLGSGLLNGNLGASPDEAEVNYQRIRPAIQKTLDQVYGEGVMQAPANYDEGFARSLAQAGFTGTNVARYQTAVMSEQNKRELQGMKSDTQLHVAKLNGEYRLEAARILANAQLTRAEKERQLKMLPVSVTTTEEQSGSIIMPTTQKTVTTGYAPGGAPAPSAGPSAPTQAGPKPGYINPHGMQFQGGDWRDPNNWKKVR